MSLVERGEALVEKRRRDLNLTAYTLHLYSAYVTSLIIIFAHLTNMIL